LSYTPLQSDAEIDQMLSLVDRAQPTTSAMVLKKDSMSGAANELDLRPTADVGDLVKWNLTYNRPYKHPEDITHVSEGLRLAGLLE